MLWQVGQNNREINMTARSSRSEDNPADRRGFAPKVEGEILDDRAFENHDELIDKAVSDSKHGVRTDAYAEGHDYIGVDDIDRIRRKNLKHKIK